MGVARSDTLRDSFALARFLALGRLARFDAGLGGGAELEHDGKTGFYRIAKILKGSTWQKDLRSPLAELASNLL